MHRNLGRRGPGDPEPQNDRFSTKSLNHTLLQSLRNALELVSGADFLCTLMCGAGPVDLRGSRVPRGRPDPENDRFSAKSKTPFLWVPEGSLAGVFGCREIALELVSGADYSCKLMHRGVGSRRSKGVPGSISGLKPGKTESKFFSQTAFRYPFPGTMFNGRPVGWAHCGQQGLLRLAHRRDLDVRAIARTRQVQGSPALRLHLPRYWKVVTTVGCFATSTGLSITGHNARGSCREHITLPGGRGTKNVKCQRNGLRIGFRGWFLVQIDVPGEPRRSRGVPGSISGLKPRKTGPKIFTPPSPSYPGSFKRTPGSF